MYRNRCEEEEIECRCVTAFAFATLSLRIDEPYLTALQTASCTLKLSPRLDYCSVVRTVWNSTPAVVTSG